MIDFSLFRCLFGHKPDGLITGFRNLDGAAICHCRECGLPIVLTSIKLSEDLRAAYHEWENEQPA